MDPQSRPIASLADSWKLVAPDSWEFKLHPGVKFHTGDDFTADDVAYTLARVPTVPNSPGSFAIYTKAVVATEIVDPHTIRLKTNGLYPLLPIDLAQILIIPKRLGPNPTRRCAITFGTSTAATRRHTDAVVCVEVASPGRNSVGRRVDRDPDVAVGVCHEHGAHSRHDATAGCPGTTA